MITIRSILEVIMTYTFLAALFNMNVANANAILQLIPLMVLLGSFIFYAITKDIRMDCCLGWMFWCSYNYSPGSIGFQLLYGSCLVAVFCLSARDLLTVRLNKNIPSNIVAFYSALMLTMVSFLLSEDTIFLKK